MLSENNLSEYLKHVRCYVFSASNNGGEEISSREVWNSIIWGRRWIDESKCCGTEFFFSGFRYPKKPGRHIRYSCRPDFLIRKKLAGAFFVFASKSTFEVLTPPPLHVWLMGGGGAQKISQSYHKNPFLISRISLSFEKFYADTNFFSKIFS